jgi:hypothetical protein
MKNARKASFHENLLRGEEELRPASNRSFGLVFAAALGVIGLAPLARSHACRPWALILAAGFCVVAVVRPEILRPLNLLWTRLGMLLQSITQPVITALLFFGAVTPLALLSRFRGRDPLRLRWDRDARSYWLKREPGPRPESMRDQF